MVIRFSRSLLAATTAAAADRWRGVGLKLLLVLLLELFLRKDVEVGSSTCKDTTPVEVVTFEPRGRSAPLLLLVSPDDDVVVIVVVVVLGVGTGPPDESCDDDL